MPKYQLGIDVVQAAYERIRGLYRDGHTVVCSFSAGKDSTCVLELAVMAARDEGKLPVNVIMRDEEIMLPGTYEYAERVATRPELNFHWVIAGQPIINVFNRKQPYWWVFDQQLPQEKWLRQPPPYAYWIDQINIEHLIIPSRFPVAEGKMLVGLIGLRAAESPKRKMAIFSSGSFMSQKPVAGMYRAKPIYDWTYQDVWKFIKDNKFDYNKAYDVMARFGVQGERMRIAPPTMSASVVNELQMAMQAWPKWFDKLNERVPGMRTVAQFGKRALRPRRNSGELWSDTYQRECIDKAPAWIAERAIKLRDEVLRHHAKHTSLPFPQKETCPRCPLGSWKILANTIYMGDPFSLKTSGILKQVEPEKFRVGAGTWGGSATW